MHEKYKNLFSEPEHSRKADIFVTTVLSSIKSQFPQLTIHAINQTKDDLGSFSGMMNEAKLQGDKEMQEDLLAMADATDRDSASMTVVNVTLTGDTVTDLDKAENSISLLAKQSNGKKTDDTGNRSYGAKKALDMLFGHRPQHEDLASYERFLTYIFS